MYVGSVLHLLSHHLCIACICPRTVLFLTSLFKLIAKFCFPTNRYFFCRSYIGPLVQVVVAEYQATVFDVERPAQRHTTYCADRAFCLLLLPPLPPPSAA